MSEAAIMVKLHHDEKVSYFDSDGISDGFHWDQFVTILLHNFFGGFIQVVATTFNEWMLSIILKATWNFNKESGKSLGFIPGSSLLGGSCFSPWE